jgi:hypothetical protein
MLQRENVRMLQRGNVGVISHGAQHLHAASTSLGASLSEHPQRERWSHFCGGPPK